MLNLSIATSGVAINTSAFDSFKYKQSFKRATAEILLFALKSYLAILAITFFPILFLGSFLTTERIINQLS